MTIILLVLIIMNWFLYHKIFHVVIYFDLGAALFKELAISFFMACIELAVLMTFGPYLLAIAAVIAVIWGIGFMLKK